MRIHNRLVATIVFGVILALLSISIGCQSSSATPAATAKPAEKATSAPKTESAAPKAETKDAPKTESAAPKAESKAPAAAEAKPGQLTTVRMGILNIETSAPAWIGKEKGYFAQQGIDLQTNIFQSAVQMLPLMATGQLDVGVGGINAALWNAIKRDVPVKMVADYAHFEKDRSGAGFVVRKDLWESGAIKTPADLKGKTIAINQEGSVSELLADRLVQKAGLTLKDVKIVQVDLTDVVTALANKSIDVGFVIEPMVTMATERTGAHMLATTDELYPGQQNAIVTYAPHFANQNDLAKRFLLAWEMGVRDYERAFFGNGNKDEIVKILVANGPVKDPALLSRIGRAAVNPDAYVNTKSLEEDQNWYIQHGYVKEKVDLSQVVDNQFADYVISQLGKYKP